VLFGHVAHELDLVGLRVPEDRAWLFNGVRRKVTRLGWREMEMMLDSRTSDETEQLGLNPFSLAF
jgi:hypothetical protein